MPVLDEIIHTFLEASPYLLLGLFFSAIIQCIVPKEKISRWIGRNNTGSVFIAAGAGVPLPLCSCGVIPMAMSLRKSGASRGATIAFLISTPETGLDSIMLSVALLNPFIAIFRPVAALFTALLAGITENVFDRSKDQLVVEEVPKDCCSHKAQPTVSKSWGKRIFDGFHSSFVDLLGDIAPWLLLGLVLSGIISSMVPSSVIEKFLGPGIGSMLLMLVVGIPLYICASASTPIAASLLLHGASPGAVLVFLLAGPATNMTTILMVYKFLGRRALIIYLGSIAVCSLGFGVLLNNIYANGNIDIRQTIGQAAHCMDTIWQVSSAVILVILMLYSLGKKYL